MAKVLMTVELDYDADITHGSDEIAIAWFFEEILSDEKGGSCCCTLMKLEILSGVLE
ncbi:hypothetical protein phiA009_0188 [Aeromonas phage phiA009]|nr:hypothetical protein phiA009_0188 [Aeromonas phage phiA009]